MIYQIQRLGNGILLFVIVKSTRLQCGSLINFGVAFGIVVGFAVAILWKKILDTPLVIDKNDQHEEFTTVNDRSVQSFLGSCV